MTRRIEERQILVRDALQLATLVAVLNGESSWKAQWDRILPGIEPPRWTVRSPFRRFFSLGVTQPSDFIRRTFRKQLLVFIEGWRDVGESFQDFWESCPLLAEKLQLACRNTRLEVMLGPDGELVLGPIGALQNMDFGVFLACWEFLDFVQNPLRARLGRCLDCKTYYVATRSSPYKSYCSRLCRRRRAPKITMRRERAEKRRQKMERVQAALKLLALSSESVADWKGWIADHAGVTRTWLTLAVKMGDLEPPRIRKQEHA
jgi:hypothetical protein